MDQELKTFLNKHSILYSEYKHPAVFTVAESDKVTKHIPGLRTKSLFLKDNLGQFYLVCMPSAKRLDIKHLKKYFQVKKLNFATPEELAAELQLKPGSVSPLAMIHAKNTIILILRLLIFYLILHKLLIVYVTIKTFRKKKVQANQFRVFLFSLQSGSHPFQIPE